MLPEGSRQQWGAGRTGEWRYLNSADEFDRMKNREIQTKFSLTLSKTRWGFLFI